MTQNPLKSKISIEHMDYLKKKIENNKPKRIKISLYPKGEETKNNVSYYESKPALNAQMNLSKSFSLLVGALAPVLLEYLEKSTISP